MGEYMPFTKGQSGNPNGRPRKGRTLTETLEKAMKKKREDGKKNSDALADTLIELAITEKNVTAIKYIMDRVDGKPAESIELTGCTVDQRLREIMNGSK
jgi:hypothetical protein